MIHDRVDPPELRTERLMLEPVRVEHAAGLADALAAEANYRFIGGQPQSQDSWQRRLSVWEQRHSPDRSESWLNWAVRLRATEQLIGYVQATVVSAKADVAYMIGVPWQCEGFACEATAAMISSLVNGLGVEEVRAWIGDGHEASRRVAAACGLRPTEEIDTDGERLWTRGSGGELEQAFLEAPDGRIL
jgi:RimJ/RimL family protein N-acetyltransferase